MCISMEDKILQVGLRIIAFVVLVDTAKLSYIKVLNSHQQSISICFLTSSTKKALANFCFYQTDGAKWYLTVVIICIPLNCE